MPVQVDAACAAGKTCDITVAGQRPCGAVLDLDIDIAAFSVTVDRPIEAAALLELEIQGRNLIYDHVAVDCLL